MAPMLNYSFDEAYLLPGKHLKDLVRRCQIYELATFQRYCYYFQVAIHIVTEATFARR